MFTIAKMHYDFIVRETKDFFAQAGFSKAIVGLSGGVDSAVVACIATEALGAENVLTVAMPSKYSAELSLSSAQELAKNLGTAFEVHPIEAHRQALVAQLSLSGLAEENSQARLRGLILMSLANKLEALVLATGNRSEILTGYCTMYGDTVGAFAPLANNYKTGVYALARYINRDEEIVPQAILTRAPSAELTENQKDENELGAYEALDAFLQAYEGGASEEFLFDEFSYEYSQRMIHRIQANAWKRQQLPPGPQLPSFASPNIMNVQRS